MRRRGILALSAFIFCLVSCGHYASAQNDTSADNIAQTQEGRYVLVTVSKTPTYSGTYGTSTRKTPAVVLDTYLGIVWRCKDIRDGKPLWIKNDLAKSPNQQPTNKKYIINIPAYSGEDYKIPAIVLDIETGKSWTCPNITDENATWVQTDLPKDISKEGYVAAP